MPSHAEFVAAFGGGIMDGTLPAGATAPDPKEAARRFAVYRNNVAHGLTKALASRFPVVQRLVGEDFFHATARIFAVAHPPTSPVLLAWGAELPRFLMGFPPVQGLRYLPDVARVELARGIAFHAADHAPLPRASLARAAQDPSRARLRLHPSVQMVASGWSVVSIWRANQPGSEAGRLRADRPETALILRDRSFEVPVQTIGPGDAAILQAMLRGDALLPCAAAGARAEPGHDPGPLLARLAQAGALIPHDAEDQP